MKAKPEFSVDIKKNDKVLSFMCSFLPSEYSETKESNGIKLALKIRFDFNIYFIRGFRNQSHSHT